MTRRTHLWSTAEVGVHRFDHPPGDCDCGPVDELGERFSASFVETGSFDVEVDGRAWRLNPGDMLLVHPGMRFRIAHHDGDLSDVCLSVTYHADTVEGTDRACHWAHARAPVLRADNRLRYLHWGLRRALNTDTPLLAETCAAELFRELPESRAETAQGQKSRTFDRYAQGIHAARECIDQRFAEALRLHDLAGLAHMSTFHFARLFAELVGQPPHRYLSEARLRAAATMLRDGRSVTDTCYACGFNDMSHFSRAFSQRHGRSPSAYALAPG